MNVEKIKRALKSCLPWRVRYFIKLQEAEGKIHLSEKIKQYRGIEEYNQQLYQTLDELKIESFEDKVVCELGPGQHLSHAFLEYQMGAKKEWLLEIADFAHVNETAKVEDLHLDNNLKKINQLPAIEQNESWLSYLAKVNATYITTGINGYKNIPDGSVDYCFSYAVLEHIRRNIVEQTIEEMYRFTRNGGVGYHTVDFSDHLGGGKNQLRFPEYIWEDENHRRMDNYTNRISCSEYCELLKKTGFEIVGLNKRKYKKAPIKRSKLDAAFKDMSEDDLLTSNAIIVTRKK